MSKIIFLYVAGEGWKEFDLEVETTAAELKTRNIEINPNAKIGSNATIGDDAKIGSNAKIGDDATIGDDAVVRSICISGTGHTVLWWGEDKIQIGCKHRTIAEWIEGYQAVGCSEGYTPDQIAEYGGYIKMIAAYAATLTPKPAEA
ncbi:MAG TPA: hypothetical protein VGM89_15600 [Puia sp.]